MSCRTREESCSFTGHRVNKLPWRDDESDPRCVELKNKIRAAVAAMYDSGKRHFLCGMATGCDLYFCEILVSMREIFSDITIEAALPWAGQSEQWPDYLKEKHSRLLEECDCQTVIQTEYSFDCMTRRNKYMVENSSALIACYDGKPGGTQQTMLYAIRQGLEIIEIPIT